ncbi:MAG: hypothetical protein Ta2E_04590 [Mycoplasmoidaceae bacterium]|nr:MAG: hypothetical protein Ta2E_04590 [Mycoplasmoidaceae bacterium]
MKYTRYMKILSTVIVSLITVPIIVTATSCGSNATSLSSFWDNDSDLGFIQNIDHNNFFSALVAQNPRTPIKMQPLDVAISWKTGPSGLGSGEAKGYSSRGYKGSVNFIFQH